MRLVRLAALTAILWAGSALPARADIIDFGVDILSGGTTSQILNGFLGDENGYSLSNSCVGLILVCTQRSYDFGVDTSTLADPNVESALLSFDFSGLGLLETFNVFAYSGSSYQYLGLLGMQPLALNLNLFGDEIASGMLYVRVETAGLLFEAVRLDGANLHIETSIGVPAPTTRVPEPATFMLTGVGMAAAAAFHRRRRRTVRPTA
jgi:hypothetical protein